MGDNFKFKAYTLPQPVSLASVASTSSSASSIASTSSTSTTSTTFSSVASSDTTFSSVATSETYQLAPTNSSEFLSERNGLVVPQNFDALLRERMLDFRVTSDESFEASLMAGGYGKYKTIDGKQPPPPPPAPPPLEIQYALPPPPQAHPPNYDPSFMYVPKRRPPQAKALPEMKLQILVLPGHGRVLVPAPVSASPSPSPSRPDWPDGVFPWRARWEERVKAREEAMCRFLEAARWEEEDGEKEEEPSGLGRYDHEEDAVDTQRDVIERRRMEGGWVSWT